MIHCNRFVTFAATMMVAIVAVMLAAQTTETFTDTRDNKTYRTVRIGNRTWMAENLNYRTKDSWCYDNADSNCVKYGRMYTWDAAMTACPAGWRLPNNAEWDDLTLAVGGGSVAGTKLKSKSGWSNNGNGTDEYGFSALPGGSRNSGNFNFAGDYGSWWSATEVGSMGAYTRLMGWHYKPVSESNSDKNSSRSVRCVRD